MALHTNTNCHISSGFGTASFMPVHCNSFTLRFSLALSGVPIDLPHVSKRVYTYTDLEWFLRDVARAVGRPQAYIRLHAFGKCVQDQPLNGTRTLLHALAVEHKHPEDVPIDILVELLPAPCTYTGTLCLCDFGGCCCLCRVPSNTVCEGCGNNGCCRCGNCGHKCCVGFAGTTAVLPSCAIQGCQPHWASHSLRGRKKGVQMCSVIESPICKTSAGACLR